jgi:putative PepSY-like beta-lactamase-inhibitor
MRLPGVFLGFCGAAWAAGLAVAEPQKVAAEKVPPAVWKTIQAQSGGKQPSHIERDDAGGTVTYEAAFPVGTDDERTVTVAGDGRLLQADVELAETPAAVQKTITTQLSDATLDGIEKNLEGDETTYEVDFTTKAGQEKSMSIDQEGTLLSLELTLEETPPAVQAAIKTQVADGKLDQIEKSFDDEAVSYDVAATTKAGKERNFTLAADGTLASVEVTLAEVAAPAQKTIQKRIGTGQLLRVAETFENQKLAGYEVDGMVDGKITAFKVGLGGKFRGEEQ